MKTITVTYNEYGKITDISDNSLYFEQENESLCICAEIATDKSVRAYIKASNNNSYVTEALTKSDTGVYSFTVAGEYMSKGTMYVGFEVFDATGYIERFDPFKVYIDSFVNLGNGAVSNVYVVTVNVGEVETLEPDEDAYVVNTGNQKDMKLNFGIPKGVKGDSGEDGYTPQKGVDYYTEEDKQEFIASIEEYVDNGLAGKVDKITGKGISTNDLTNELKKKIQENTFDEFISLTAGSRDEDGNETWEDIPGTLFDNIQRDGIYKTRISEAFGDYNTHDGILICRALTTGPVWQTYLSNDGYYSREYTFVDDSYDYDNMAWSKWTSILSDVRKSIAAMGTNLNKHISESEMLKNKGIANGYAPLDSNGLVPSKHLNNAVPHTTASGYPISLTDHLEGESVIDYKVYGNSVQDGTPSPDSPIEIESVGDLVTDTSSENYGKYDVPITVNDETKHVYLDEPLRKVGDYADYVDWENQKVVRKIKYREFSSNDNWSIYTSVANHFQITVNDNYFERVEGIKATSNYYPQYSGTLNSTTEMDYAILSVDGSRLRFRDIRYTTLDEFKAFLDTLETPLAVNYILAEPTTEPITAPDFTTPNSEVMNVSSNTTTLPSSIDLMYYQDINKVISELKNAVLS